MDVSNARVALVLGTHRSLCENLLALLVDDARYAWVHVGLRHSLGAATPKYRPWVIGRSIILADDAFVFISDSSESAVPSPIARFGRNELVRAAELARDAGVRRLVAVAQPGELPESDPAGLTEDEQPLTTMGFETLVIVRPTRRQFMPSRITAVTLLEAPHRCAAGVHVIGAREATARIG